jgi:hypothetical protein
VVKQIARAAPADLHRIDRAPDQVALVVEAERFACIAQEDGSIVRFHHGTRPRLADVLVDPFGGAVTDRYADP